jgi:glucosamine kinase
VSIIVGVDAGGTAIDCLVERPQGIVRRRGEAANARTAGVDRAACRIAQTVQATLDGTRPDAVAVGAAGAGDPQVMHALERALRAYFPDAALAVYDDAAIALKAAVPQGDGIVLIAGTGSIAYASIGGKAYRTGGYGYLLGDDGSGFSIGRAAIASVLRSYDGRIPREPLFEAIEERFGVNDAQSLLSNVYHADDKVTEIASIAPLVIERASAGERVATKIVQAAACELVDLVKSLVRLAGAGSRELPLAFCGGLFAENSLLTYLVETRLAADLPLLLPSRAIASPAHGALELARGLLG